VERDAYPRNPIQAAVVFPSRLGTVRKLNNFYPVRGLSEMR
jgi:hypothetical protein